MKFQWDNSKNGSNIEKHGLSFNDAKEVFEDSNRKEYEDDRKEYGETRLITIGLAKTLGVILFVVFTIRNRYIRIISARKANMNERKHYYSN